MDFELIEKALPILLLGAGVTIEITAVSVFIGFCIGLFVGIARICKVKVLRILAAIYADCIRGTPLLVQIFLIYFALPIVTGHRVEPFVAAVAACGLDARVRGETLSLARFAALSDALGSELGNDAG